ncbi:glycoside hydrolase family 20 protein [Rhizophagus irregularis DAOM 181602=DAOM 197198]|nr:glycoside hydrolase family 20 protein [Rhizophagus irregularis DAOM 181602=DAOM 197198]
MRLDGFQLEVLVNGQPLEEYNLPINESNPTTDSSYVLDESTRQKTYSDDVTYIAVKPEMKYSIRFSSSRASMWSPLMAYVYVDGEYDYTYREVSNSSPREKDCFWNNTLKKTIWWIRSNFIKVAEAKSTCGIKFTTAFEEAEGFSNRQAVATMERQGDEPVAVLHLHYRPATWLSIRGCNLPEIDQPNHLSPSVPGLLGDVKPYSFNIKGEEPQSPTVVKTKYKIIRAAVIHSDNVIEVTDESENRNNNEVIDLENYTPKNKRTYTKEVDVIELLDSDEEEEENPSKILRIE